MDSQTIVRDPPERSLNADVFDMADPPLVSLCVPVYNNEDIIENTLVSFVEQTYPNLEIIVVDNGSTDATVDIAKRYADNIYFEEGPMGKVRQRCVQVASGEIVGLFDSDIVFPHSEWVTEAIKYFNYDESVSTVWPENIAPPGTSPTTQLYFELWHVIEENRMKHDRGPFGGGNSLFKKDTLEDIGGIDPSLHYVDDLDWAVKLQEHGYKVVYHTDPIHHYTMLSFRAFVTKQFMVADQFTRAGGDLTGLPIRRLIYEQAILGTWGMLYGLLMERKPVWLLFPLFLLVRSLAFLTTLGRLGTERLQGLAGSDDALEDG